MSRGSQFCHLVTIFLCIWIPLSWYWLQLPSPGWLMSPAWNSLYLFLIGMVVIVGWLNHTQSAQQASLVCLAVYVIARTIYGRDPEYSWLTPAIDGIACTLCYAFGQRIAAGFFLIMVINFAAAKYLGLEPWRWQLRSNALFILQCLTLSIIWSLPWLRRKKNKNRSPSAHTNNVVKMVPACRARMANHHR